MPEPFQRANGRWTARAHIGNGTYRTRTFDTHDQARIWTIRTEADHSRGQLDNTAVTWGEARTEWLDRIRVTESSRVVYRRALERTAEWDMMPIAAIQAGHVERLLDSLTRPDGEPLSANTINTIYRRVLRGVFTRALRHKVIVHNPLVGVDWPKSEPWDGARYLTPDEVEAVAEELDGVHRDLFIFLVYTGLRIGEALGLNGDDVVNGRVRVLRQRDPKNRLVPPKNRASIREVPLNERAGAVLPHLDPKPLFLTCEGVPVAQATFRRRLAAAMVTAGVEPFRIHDLRHTCASWLIGAGGNIVHVSRWLGHAKVTQTLNTYAHLMPDELDGLAGLL